MKFYRATRFIIDKVDAKLGNVEKEIKFDKIVIGICLCIIALEIILLAFSSESGRLTVPTIVGAILAAFSICALPIMIKELKNDKEKAKRLSDEN
jgi:hypothetical protein